ncbi:MAG: endonuclease III, partial [Spirochaetales bacterium]|nr:endonuclease III [Spirochaetales bacterium]
MRVEERIVQIFEILDETLPKEIQFLDERDPFRFLISVILSAQTTDRIVNVVVKELFAAYPDAASLAHASPSDVEAIIYATGFYRA